MELPPVETVRERIELAEKIEAKFCLMAEYLFASRISEIIGRKCPSDITTTPRGMTGKDAKQTIFKNGEKKHDVAVFTVRTAKRRGKERKIALPFEKESEPKTMRISSKIAIFRGFRSVVF